MMPQRSPELARAYQACREIARREAKNFYYAFRVLPPEKSDAMCAIYAFMRKADDLADDESLPLDQRRAAMAAWTAEWRDARSTSSDDPIFLAVHDTQHRFGIPDALLDQLVQGTTMDLHERLPGVERMHVAANGLSGDAAGRDFDVYATFPDLYRYCYLVASVVGLVTIRIFGYTDPSAEQFAEHTGIAFQLTNILRDVREDAERGRIYLPDEEMRGHGVELAELAQACVEGAPSPGLLALLQAEIHRAERYYSSAEELIPLIEADARPAMRVLIEIYHRLLGRIAADPAAVFRGRVSVPTPEKLAILAGGAAGSVWARLLRPRRGARASA